MNISKALKVLVVEPDLAWHGSFAAQLEGKVEILSACSFEEAEALFAQSREGLVAVVVGTFVTFAPRQTPASLSLVRKFRESFNGPIIGISVIPDYQRLLKEAGCSKVCEKIDLPHVLLEVLHVEVRTS